MTDAFFNVNRVTKVTLLITLTTFVGCSQDTMPIQRVDFLFTVPIVELDGRLRYITDSVSIFYYQGYTVYGFPYTYSQEDETHILSQERRYNFLIRPPNSTRGSLYEVSGKRTYQKIRIDSLLLLKGPGFGKKDFFNQHNDQLVESNASSKDTFDLVEKYVPKQKPDFSYPDTVIFYFSSTFRNNDFSISKHLDSTKKRKVMKAALLFYPRYDSTYQVQLPQRHFVFEIQPRPVRNRQQLMRYIAQFKTENSR